MIVNLGESPDQRKMARLVIEVMSELSRAEEIHPTWPTDRVHEAAVNAEEAFEALQVALNMRPEDPHCGGPKGTLPEYRTELIQNAAMAFRALLHIPEGI